MTNEQIIKEAFIEACKYLQYHPPAEFESYSYEEISACAGSGSYEDGWKQWALYFINKVKEKE